MAAKKLIAMLNRLGKDAERQIQSLNCGGCAVFAAHVGYYLKYRAGAHNVQLRVGSSYADIDDVIPSVEAARNNVKPNANAMEWNMAGLSFGHVIVEFTTGKLKRTPRHYDSSGVSAAYNVTNNFGFVLHPGAMTVEEGLQIADNKQGWNDAFDRDQIPKLINIIDKHFAEYTSRV